MSRKAFCIQVELEVQSVTCPGVWLCSNGKVALHIYMLDSCIQTSSFKPLFPIQLNETFLFYKTFYPKHQLYELQRELHNQWIYIELVQWQSCEIGNVLAYFQITLDELLFPSTSGGSLAGVDLDLLMEPSRNFPGTIAPKIEVSTKTTIEETLCFCKKATSKSIVVNPKVLISQLTNRTGGRRKVCHSVGFSRRKRPTQLPKKPPFVYRKADEDLILRKPNLEVDRQRKIKEEPIENRIVRRQCPCGVTTAAGCSGGHRDNACKLCVKYKHRFTPNSHACLACNTQVQSHPRTCLFQQPVQNNPRDCEPQAPKNVCLCDAEKKTSLAAKLHERFLKTLNYMPRPQEWPCFDNEPDYTCNICESSSTKGDLYRDLQKMYQDLYDKARSGMTSCGVADCCPCASK